MEKANTRIKRHLSFTYYLIIAILLIIIPIIGLISLVDSTDVYRETTANNVVLQNQTEQTIVLSVSLVDTGLKLFDDSLNRRMQDAFKLLIEEYERSDRNPETMNLPALKEQLGGDMDIYIIDESGVIEYTTFEPDLGLDFSAYPDFYAYITDLRLGNDFSADRIVSEMSTGELRKYAYMPTPDHRYLLELGLVESEFKKARSTLKYKDTAARLVDLNPNIKYLRIFNWRGEQVTKEVVPDEAFRQSLVRQAYQQKQNCEFVNETADEKTRFIFINLKDPDYASDMSLVVELTYDTSLAAAKLQDLMDAHFKTALIAVLLAVGMAIVAAHIVTRPIRRIADDVDSIARGDLEHTISIAGGEEFARLGQSITTMVDTLKAHIQRLEASEVRLREYSEHLEEKVRDRTADLQKSNEKANLYLDIMTHDISNSNNTANLYADLLLEELAGEPE
jgi:two-component system sensor histidine kinase BarA